MREDCIATAGMVGEDLPRVAPKVVITPPLGVSAGKVCGHTFPGAPLSLVAGPRLPHQ